MRALLSLWARFCLTKAIAHQEASWSDARYMSEAECLQHIKRKWRWYRWHDAAKDRTA